VATLYDPALKGFDARLSLIDRAQVALLRELSSSLGGRLVLKGGMAMRAAVGSMRLTKDMDFDRASSLSATALKGQLKTGLRTAAANAGIRAAEVQITKDTSTTCRARLAGQAVGGIEVRFEVEVSGRRDPDRSHVRAYPVVPPAGYAMAPFTVQAYSTDMLAALKIAAAMSSNRSAARDIIDLHDLHALGADPVSLLATQDAPLLQETREQAAGKLALVGFDLAREELLSYHPLDQRETLNAEQWETMTLEAAEAIERWATQALEMQGTPR
jgi:predicted nucleotidyltransferase component of viral defense system